jgi:hypothetical protein
MITIAVAAPRSVLITGTSPADVYRIKDDPAGSEVFAVAMAGLGRLMLSHSPG